MNQKIMISLIILAWIVNASFLGFVSYRLFGAGFVCYPEGLPVVSEEKEP